MQFRGFKQVTYDEYNAIGNQNDYLGYLWFVRTIENGEVVSADIYLGTRHYGHFASESEDIAGLQSAIGDITELSGLTIANATDLTTAIKNIEEYILTLQYTAGDGISISDDKVISATTGAKSVGSITIAGGPISASGIWENDVIPEGTSVQEILTKLLCKELWPNAATLPTLSSTTVGAQLSGTKEIYSTVTVNGFTSTTTNGKFNASYTNVTQPSINTVWSDIKYTTTTSGFKGYETVTESDTAPAEQSGIVVNSEGNCTVTCTVTGNYSAPEVSPITNLGNVANGAEYTYTNGSKTATKTITIYGAYPIYANGISASANSAKDVELINASGDTMVPVEQGDDVVGTKLPLTRTGSEFAVFFAKQALAPYRIAIPEGYSIVKAYGINGLTNAYDSDQTNMFVQESSISKQINGRNTSYIVYAYQGTEGPNCVKFKLTGLYAPTW